MKLRLLPLLLIFLLASCTISKRRYMPGYSLNWKHSTVKAGTSSAQKIAHTAKQQAPVLHPAQVQNEAPVLPLKNNISSAKNKQAIYGNTDDISACKKITATNIITTQTGYQPSIPGHGSSDQQVCHQANICLTFGILFWAIPFLLIGLALIAAAPDAAASGGMSYILVLLAFIPVGIFDIIAFVIALTAGATALSKIKNNPGKYTGKWKAIIGILLVTLPIVALILALIVSR